MNKTNYGINITDTVGWTKVSNIPTPIYKQSVWTEEEIKEYSKPMTIEEKKHLDKVCAMYTREEIQRIAHPFKNEGERIAFKEWLSLPAPLDPKKK